MLWQSFKTVKQLSLFVLFWIGRFRRRTSWRPKWPSKVRDPADLGVFFLYGSWVSGLFPSKKPEGDESPVNPSVFFVISLGEGHHARRGDVRPV